MKYNYVPESGPASDAYDPFNIVHTPFPDPPISSRSAHALTFPMPGAVASLAEFAREHSWEVIMQYSQGRFPHGVTGKPGALKDVIALRFGAHPMTDRQAYAVYARTARPVGSWTWDNTMIWGPDLPPFAGCAVTDIRAFLSRPDESPAGLAKWLHELTVRNMERQRVARERAQARPKPERESLR